MSDREPNFKEEMPNGICHCGMPRMTINGTKKCPNCDTRNDKSSGLVNKVQDPGHEAFVKGALPLVPGGIEEAQHNPEYEIALAPRNISNCETYGRILILIDSLKMPNDLKQFKKVMKLKKLIEELNQGE